MIAGFDITNTSLNEDNVGLLNEPDLFSGKFTTAAGLEKIRKRLLDLTTRNRLLSFKWTKGRVLRVIATPPDDLYSNLLVNNKSLSFAPIPEPPQEDYEGESKIYDEQDKPITFKRPDVKKYAEKLGIPTSYELQSTYPDNCLLEGGLIQTLLYPEDLEGQLRKLEQTARTAIEESGTNMLYMVFGFLEWYDNKDATKPLYAPLLVLPVSLKRGRVDPTTGFFQYDLSYTGEDISDNLTLREKLRQDMSLELPDLEEEDTPEIYFEKIREFVSSRNTWKVHLQATLTLLSFGRLLMYLDLAPSRWPDNKTLDKHPLIKGFFEGFERNESPISYAPEYPIDGNPKAESIPLIDDADSSQHSALIDALDGKNIVIEGPPGTGKSQTITNLIAAALTKGKTVLFVSEKLAALEVVRRRLDKAGLGMFCLELHSHKTQKRKLLDDIQHRLDAHFSDPIKLNNLLSEAEGRRNRLKRYVEVINSVLDNQLDLTVHQILWKAERYRAALANKSVQLNNLEFPEASEIDHEYMDRLSEAVQQFGLHLTNIGGYSHEHPWFGYSLHKLVFGDESAVEKLLIRLSNAANKLEEEHARIQNEVCLMLPNSREEFYSFSAQVSQITPLDGDEATDLLPGLYSPQIIGEIETLFEDIGYINEHIPIIERVLSSPDDISTKHIECAGELLRKARLLSHNAIVSSEIVRRANELRQLHSVLVQSHKYFSEILEIACVSIPLDMEGLRLSKSVATVIKEAPLDLLTLRNAELFEASALQIADEAVEEGLKLQKERSCLASLFQLSTLPPRDEIAKVCRTFLAGGGWLSFLNSDWRVAKKLYKRLTLQKTKIKAARCAVELGNLVDFIDSRVKFEGNADYQRVLGKIFRGLDTDFKKIRRLVDWYNLAREQLLHYTVFSTGPTVRDILNLPTDRLTLFQSKVSNTELFWEPINSLGSKLDEVFMDTSVPAAITMRHATEFPQYLNSLDNFAEALVEIGNFIAGLTNEPISPQQLVTHFDELSLVRKTLESVRQRRSIQQFLGTRYQELQTDFTPIHKALKWCEQVKEVGLSHCFEYLFTPGASNRLEAFKAKTSAINTIWKSLEAIEEEFEQFGCVDWKAWYGEEVVRVTPEQIQQRSGVALQNTHVLWDWASLSRSQQTMEALALDLLAGMALKGNLLAEDLTHAFCYSFYTSIAKSILRHTPELMEFSGVSHGQVRDNFVKLDQDIIRLTGARCAHIISKRNVPQGIGRGSPKNYTERELLYHEINKKKRHISIRKMMSQAGNALQAIKPCFMMGPLSVSQYLEPGKLNFDLVVMDEASQLRPEEILGAIARGTQIIVVGDTNQLPPTNFFDRFMTEDSDEDEVGAVEGAESILDISKFLFQPVRTLRWHYRSQHESLIAFSNRHFYDDKLIVFPSAHGHEEGLGVRYHFVADALYENRRNRQEAKRVADAVLNHFLNRKDESLGVVTLNLTQKDLIEEEVENHLKTFKDAEHFLSKWEEGGYPFFVKNLENVQGDERDVIFVSTTFGPDSKGAIYQRFGPINRDKGWRRLNVLFTRSRKRMEIFSSLQPEDISLTDRTSRGAKALRDYLAYAKDGILEAPTITGRDPDSDFEIAVGDVLRNHDYKVEPQLGVAGFFIDLAVRNPDREGEFLAGIECDGATYHSGLSVRDRDRLRQQILERLGWEGKIYRIWSTDWFRDPRGQVKRLLAFLEDVREKSRNETTTRIETALPLFQFRERLDLTSNQVATLTGSGFCVEVGDCVTYFDVESPTDHKMVQIVERHPDPSSGIIAANAPLAQALLGSEIGDEVEFRLPQGKKVLQVFDIER
jgi:transcription elongation GreA/GreB family factor